MHRTTQELTHAMFFNDSNKRFNHALPMIEYLKVTLTDGGQSLVTQACCSFQLRNIRDATCDLGISASALV